MTKSRRERIKKAKVWFASQKFKNEDDILPAYRKEFQVDRICAMRDLCGAGVLSAKMQAVYEKKLSNRAEHFEQKRERKRKEKEYELLKKELGYDPEFQDETFAYIAGYTPGGAPYGVTWEEMEEMERREAGKKESVCNLQTDWNEELPF